MVGTLWAWVIGGLAITALQLPSLIQAQTVDTPVTKCDRVGSREANAVIATVLQPRIDKLGYTVPESCPLDVNKNMFKVQEAHKVLMRKSIWKCKWDDKVFRGESFIDIHMEKYHSHETSPGATTCLASVCGPLHCDFFEHARKGKLAHLQTIPCHGRTMEMHREKCVQLAHNCFPQSAGSAAEHLHAFMMQTFCEAATCRWSRRLELLKPLTHHSNTQYLRLVLVVATVFVLMVAYTFMALNWSNKTSCGSNSVQRMLENMGIVKPKARKLL